MFHATKVQYYYFLHPLFPLSHIFIYFNSVSTENFTLSELSGQEIDELIDYYKRNNPKGYNYISIHNHIAFSNLIKNVEYLKKHHKQYETDKMLHNFMEEMIPFTRNEFVEIMLPIVSANESIDIKKAEGLIKYIPKNFLIKRGTFLYYLKNEKQTDEVRSLLELPEKEQIKYFKVTFISTTPTNIEKSCQE